MFSRFFSVLFYSLKRKKKLTKENPTSLFLNGGGGEQPGRKALPCRKEEEEEDDTDFSCSTEILPHPRGHFPARQRGLSPGSCTALRMRRFLRRGNLGAERPSQPGGRNFLATRERDRQTRVGGGSIVSPPPLPRIGKTLKQTKQRSAVLQQTSPPPHPPHFSRVALASDQPSVTQRWKESTRSPRPTRDFAIWISRSVFSPGQQRGRRITKGVS